MIKGYIFDYGGTIDTSGCHWGKMIWHAYERQGVPVDWGQFCEAYVHAERVLGRNPIIQPSFTFKQTLAAKLKIEMEYLMNKGYLQVSPLELGNWHDAVCEDLYSLVVEETSRSREVLVSLSEKYPLVLVSNFYGNIAEVLKEFRLDGLFKDIIESAVVGVRKPNPAIYRLGVETIGFAADEIAVVGDSISKDMIPAKSLGCKTVWIRGEAWDDEPQDTTSVDYAIGTLQELLRL